MEVLQGLEEGVGGRTCGGKWASELTDFPKEITFRGNCNELLPYCVLIWRQVEDLRKRELE